MSISTISRQAVQVAIAVEIAWALFLAYEIHSHAQYATFGATLGWDVQLANFILQWAAPAIAIVVVTWLVDTAVRQARGPAVTDRPPVSAPDP
jgi:hypothetical protein